MKKRSLMLAMLCLLLGISTIVTGCGKEDVKESEAIKISKNGEFPIVEEPVELTVWAILSSGVDDYSTNYQSAWYEDYSGVKINWINVPAQGWADSFKTSVMGGDYPDIYLYDFDTSEVQACAELGAIIPLNDLIEEHCPNIKEILDKNPKLKESITDLDGNIYTLFSESYNLNSYTQKMWVNRAWLELYKTSTGNDMPQTTEEFEYMLQFFKENDMNGNGDNTDEIPYMGSNGLDGMFNLFGSFVPSVSNINSFGCYDSEEGSSVFAYTSEEYRDALKYIKGLFDKELISEQTFTISNKDRFAYTSGRPEDVRVGVVTGVTVDNVVQLQNEEGALDYSDYVALPSLEGPKGVRSFMSFGENTIALKNAITTKCEHPEIAAKWLDYWYSEEGRLWSVNGGLENEDWWYEDTSEGKTVVHSEESMQTSNFCWRGQGVNYTLTTEDFELMNRSELGTNSYLATYLANVEYSKYAKEVNWPSIVWMSEENSENAIEYSELASLIRDYVQVSYTDFIFSKKDIYDDATWESYLSELENIGVSRFVELVDVYKNAK